jgi:hypothetical protein
MKAWNTPKCIQYNWRISKPGSADLLVDVSPDFCPGCYYMPPNIGKIHMYLVLYPNVLHVSYCTYPVYNSLQLGYM